MDPNLFDANAFLSADQVLQLQDLFGQDEHDFDREASLLYDEFTFAPETVNNVSAMEDTIEPSDLINTNYVDNIINTIVTEVPMTKRRRSSSCSTSSSLSSHFSSSSSSEDEDAGDFSSINNRRFSMSSSSSSDSEPEQEVITPYLHRRQMEEMILDKITNHLDPEKLPGILAIISKAHEDEVEEVEIDLAKLDRDQLERILSYVNACLIEKEGGAKVKLSEYIIQHKPVVQQQQRPEERVDFATKQQQPKSKNKRKNNRRKSIVEAGHTVSGTSTSRLSASHGPISMSALTELESKSKTSKNNKRKRRAKKNRKDDDVSVHMSTTNVNPFKDSIASTKPKRKSAIHKRRLLEEMLQPSNEDSDDEDEEGDNGSGIIVFGDEQMDMAVTHNETIVHQEQSSTVEQEMPAPIATVVETIDDDDEDDDESIDIMM